MTKSTNTPSKRAPRSSGKPASRKNKAVLPTNEATNAPEPEAPQSKGEPAKKGKAKASAPKAPPRQQAPEREQSQQKPDIVEETRGAGNRSAASGNKATPATHKKNTRKQGKQPGPAAPEPAKAVFPPSNPAEGAAQIIPETPKSPPPPNAQNTSARPAPLPPNIASMGIISRPQGAPPSGTAAKRPDTNGPVRPPKSSTGNGNQAQLRSKPPQQRTDPRPPARQNQHNTPPPPPPRPDFRQEPPAPSPDKEVNIRLDQSVAILIDGNNIEMSLHSVSKNTSSMINFDRLVPALLGNRALSRLIYFREGKSISPKLAERLQKLFHGSVVPCHKSADIPLSIKAVQVASKVDTIIILSGDADYVELVRHLKHDGLRVEIAAFPETTADILRYESDYFFPITVEYSFALK